MRTDPATLDGQAFDVVVVGGGIQGAAIAREAALRGATTLLVERDDFGSGTSMRSSRLVHGGVRYLRQGHLSLVREALAERERLLRLAPHLVRPLPMLMPYFRDGGGDHPWLVRLGLRMYSWLARGSTMPRPRYHGPADCQRLFPGLRSAGLRGGSLFFDGRTEDLRLTLAVLEAAARAGAKLVNHTELTGVTSGGGLELRDAVAERAVVVRGRHVINAAGPGVDALRRAVGIEGDDLVRISRGSHIVLPPRQSETALGAFLPDGRIQFVVPHPDGTLCGTTDVETDTAEGPPPAEDLEYIRSALAHLLDPAPAAGDARFAYTGWRALPRSAGPPGALNREAFTVAESLPRDAGTLHTVVGGKLTTHRSFAERTVAALLGCSTPSPSRTETLPGGDGPREVQDPLWWRWGSRSPAVRALAAEDPTWLEPIAADRDLLRVEAVFALRYQGAVTFTDLVLRRLFHTQGPTEDEAALRALHQLYVEQRASSRPADFDTDHAALRRAVEAARGPLEVLHGGHS